MDETCVNRQPKWLSKLNSHNSPSLLAQFFRLRLTKYCGQKKWNEPCFSFEYFILRLKTHKIFQPNTISRKQWKSKNEKIQKWKKNTTLETVGHNFFLFCSSFTNSLRFHHRVSSTGKSTRLNINKNNFPIYMVKQSNRWYNFCCGFNVCTCVTTKSTYRHL